MKNTRNYPKRQNFAEGGSANPSMDAVKQLVADLKLDEGVKRIKDEKTSGSNVDSGSAFVGGKGGGYGKNVYADDGSQWESNQPRYDANGMPLHRVLRTPMGSIPLAKGGVVPERKVK